LSTNEPGALQTKLAAEAHNEKEQLLLEADTKQTKVRYTGQELEGRRFPKENDRIWIRVWLK
jgi:hypothetical protein